MQLPGGSARGTGLGLAIARRLVEAHGGVIWVESEPGKGSKFSVVIAPGPGGQVTSAPNILLVDDEPSVLRYTKTLLEIDNYHVETAGSGEEALQRMNRGPAPNLIVLDLVMPGMDGLQTLESCKKLRPEQKVVMISCVNDTNKVVQAIQMGASDYVTKPFLLAAVSGRGAQGPGSTSRPVKTEASQLAKGTEMVDELDDDLFFLAASPAMKQIRAQVALIAKVNVPVLLLGESGVGKEILARLIHKMSVPRSPFHGESELRGIACRPAGK